MSPHLLLHFMDMSVSPHLLLYSMEVSSEPTLASAFHRHVSEPTLASAFHGSLSEPTLTSAFHGHVCEPTLTSAFHGNVSAPTSTSCIPVLNNCVHNSIYQYILLQSSFKCVLKEIQHSSFIGNSIAKIICFCLTKVLSLYSVKQKGCDQNLSIID